MDFRHLDPTTTSAREMLTKGGQTARMYAHLLFNGPT